MQELSDLIQDILVTLPPDEHAQLDEFTIPIPSINRINQIKFSLNLLTRLHRRLVKNYPQVYLNSYIKMA
jgi:hypothetical protein